MGMHFFLIDKNVHVHMGFVQLPLFFSLGSNIAFFLGSDVASSPFFSILLFFSFDFLGPGHDSCFFN